MFEIVALGIMALLMQRIDHNRKLRKLIAAHSIGN